MFFVGVDSRLEWSLLRKRGGDSGGFKSEGLSSAEGSGGNGIVGIEYSLGKAYDETEGIFLCRAPLSNRLPSNVGRGGGDSFEELMLLAGETPLIFDNNYVCQPDPDRLSYLFIAASSWNIPFYWGIFNLDIY